MASPLEIMVRSRVELPNGTVHSEWTETVRTWKAAWRMVDDCLGDRAKCKTGSPLETKRNRGFWFLDITA